jgi:hypothetical protein
MRRSPLSWGGTLLVSSRPHLHGAEVTDVGVAHVPVSERRQNRADVADEGRVGPDDEDVLGADAGLVVEQPAHTVERHGRLTSAGASLHDEELVERGADDLVLRRLDRADDLLHLAGAVAGELAEEMIIGLGFGKAQSGDARWELSEDDVVAVDERVVLAGLVDPEPDNTRGEREWMS